MKFTVDSFEMPYCLLFSFVEKHQFIFGRLLILYNSFDAVVALNIEKNIQ